MKKIKFFVIDEAREEFEKLNKIVGKQKTKGIKNSEEIQLFNAIKNKHELITSNPAYGTKIPKKYWPKILVRKYNLTNLWRVELTNYWRMLYTLRGDQIEVLCFVINILDHKKYNKLFGYKNK